MGQPAHLRREVLRVGGGRADGELDELRGEGAWSGVGLGVGLGWG